VRTTRVDLRARNSAKFIDIECLQKSGFIRQIHDPFELTLDELRVRLSDIGEINQTPTDAPSDSIELLMRRPSLRVYRLLHNICGRTALRARAERSNYPRMDR
jgi:hypothetical protein